mgnify:CR=1 FL=1
MSGLDANYWNDRYVSGSTGWDIGYVSPPLKEYIDRKTNKDLSILIPGGGNGYEAWYLYEKGFQNVHLLDFSEYALDRFSEKHPEFPQSNIHWEDYFSHQGRYDLILEQTFFCALEPKLREKYVEKTHSLLTPGGKLVGVLWDDPMFSDRPPFGGNKEEYGRLFSKHFDIRILEEAYNSIPQRAGREVFLMFVKA